MNPLLVEFLTETRETLEGIGGLLMELERTPTNPKLINELFRLVHTLKGCSGFFSFPEMTRVLHAGEDLMAAMRQGEVCYTQNMADQLLEAMDFVALLCDDVESSGGIAAIRADDSAQLAKKLRGLIRAETTVACGETQSTVPAPLGSSAVAHYVPSLADISEQDRVEAFRHIYEKHSLYWIVYTPVEQCFFQGTDPFACVRQTPGLIFGRMTAREPWPKLVRLDAYRCVTDYYMLAAASKEELAEHFRLVPDQVCITSVDPFHLIVFPEGGKECKEEGLLTEDALENIQFEEDAPLWSTRSLNPETETAFFTVLDAVRQVLQFEDRPAWFQGRLKAAAKVMAHCFTVVGDTSAPSEIRTLLTESLEKNTTAPLQDWLSARMENHADRTSAGPQEDDSSAKEAVIAAPGNEGSKFGRRAEDQLTTKVLKVDQGKVDRLMDLIGEMVVSKNALPYLAQRAEKQFNVRELSREIKTQYAVINRIVEEMQDAIMQVRMMPVSAIFQRFSRLVRDISRKLGKEVELVLEGEETEADKNIIESLADPLVHIVRNSLDHGLELPEVRRACGKPTKGTLVIRASQDADRVLIEIRDDGKGIDPEIVKKKAFEKKLIDEAMRERMSDEEAVNLVFAAGFSTAETVSDLSGRGVGMDVVRTAVENVNGTLQLSSEVGKGTVIRISLPLSMAVTKVMIVESDQQVFGIPMDHVVETVRIPCKDIGRIKLNLTTVFRGKILPLKTLNELLNLPAVPASNDNDEMAVLVVRVGNASLGLIVDDFRETLDVIQKPLGSVLSGLNAYSGSSLMGDGTVLMILNVKELL